MFVSGVMILAGGKGQLAKHMGQGFHEHAGVSREAVSNAACLGRTCRAHKHLPVQSVNGAYGLLRAKGAS